MCEETCFCFPLAERLRIQYLVHAELIVICSLTADSVSLHHAFKQWTATILHHCFCLYAFPKAFELSYWFQDSRYNYRRSFSAPFWYWVSIGRQYNYLQLCLSAVTNFYSEIMAFEWFILHFKFHVHFPDSLNGTSAEISRHPPPSAN